MTELLAALSMPAPVWLVLIIGSLAWIMAVAADQHD